MSGSHQYISSIMLRAVALTMKIVVTPNYGPPYILNAIGSLVTVLLDSLVFVWIGHAVGLVGSFVSRSVAHVMAVCTYIHTWESGEPPRAITGEVDTMWTGEDDSRGSNVTYRCDTNVEADFNDVTKSKVVSLSSHRWNFS